MSQDPKKTADKPAAKDKADKPADQRAKDLAVSQQKADNVKGGAASGRF